MIVYGVQLYNITCQIVLHNYLEILTTLEKLNLVKLQNNLTLLHTVNHVENHVTAICFNIFKCRVKCPVVWTVGCQITLVYFKNYKPTCTTSLLKPKVPTSLNLGNPSFKESNTSFSWVSINRKFRIGFKFLWAEAEPLPHSRGSKEVFEHILIVWEYHETEALLLLDRVCRLWRYGSYWIKLDTLRRRCNWPSDFRKLTIRYRIKNTHCHSYWFR